MVTKYSPLGYSASDMVWLVVPGGSSLRSASRPEASTIVSAPTANAPSPMMRHTLPVVGLGVRKKRAVDGRLLLGAKAW